VKKVKSALQKSFCFIFVAVTVAALFFFFFLRKLCGIFTVAGWKTVALTSSFYGRLTADQKRPKAVGAFLIQNSRQKAPKIAKIAKRAKKCLENEQLFMVMIALCLLLLLLLLRMLNMPWKMVEKWKCQMSLPHSPFSGHVGV